MDLRIRRLQEATEFSILGNNEEIQKMTSELLKNQHSHTTMLEEQMQVMSVVRDTTESIRDDMAKLRRALDNRKREQSKQRCSGEQKGKPSAAEHNKHPSAKGIPLNIEIAREKQMMDLRTIIWARINSLSALKKFSRYVQQRVADKTEEIAPIKIRSSGPRPSFFDMLELMICECPYSMPNTC